MPSEEGSPQMKHFLGQVLMASPSEGHLFTGLPQTSYSRLNRNIPAFFGIDPHAGAPAPSGDENTSARGRSIFGIDLHADGPAPTEDETAPRVFSG